MTAMERIKRSIAARVRAAYKELEEPNAGYALRNPERMKIISRDGYYRFRNGYSLNTKDHASKKMRGEEVTHG